MAVLEFSAPLRAAELVPLFGKFDTHAADVAPLVFERRVALRAPERRRRQRRSDRFVSLVLPREASRNPLFDGRRLDTALRKRPYGLQLFPEPIRQTRL